MWQGAQHRATGEFRQLSAGRAGHNKRTQNHAVLSPFRMQGLQEATSGDGSSDQHQHSSTISHCY
jgi:hypothetical protein